MHRATLASLLSLATMLASCGGSDGGSTASSAAPGASQTGAVPPAPGTSSSGVSGTTLPAEKTCALANFDRDLLALVNQVRATARNCGSAAFPAAGPLTWNSKLFDAAAAHAADMAANDYFAHDSPDGRTFSQRISAAGYAWSTVGENIAGGQRSVEQVMAAWLDSPPHCAAIMNPAFTEFGVSCTSNGNSTYDYYWAMELGRPQ